MEETQFNMAATAMVVHRNQHKNGCNLVKFKGIDLKFSILFYI